MPVYQVPITGADGTAGTITVNASDPGAAQENAKQGGNQPAGDAIQVQGSGPAQTSSINYTRGGGGGGGQGNADELSAAIDRLVAAQQAGDDRAFNEEVRKFNATFGLDTRKFEEDTRRFNQNFGLTQAGVTGTYQGAPTLPALTSYATQFGQWGVPTQGQSTLAAQNQAYTQQLGAINAAAQLQANPWRQQQVIGQLGQVLGGGPVAAFQAPNTVAGVGTAGGNTRGGMGYLSQLIQDIRDPVPNTTSMNQVLNAIPTPNRLNSVEFNRAAPSTQNLVLTGMQERYGLDPADSLKQIQATLPQYFQAPSTMGTVRR